MMSKKCLTGFVVLAMLAAVAPVAGAEEMPSADEIVRKAQHMNYYQGEDGVARVKMTIVDSQGRERNKEFTILRKDKEGEEDADQYYYVYFHEPADERGTVFMVWKHVGRDDDRWLYLPGLDVTKRIAASDERTSFVGSHFFYEDVSGRGTEEDEHELLADKTNDTYFVIKNTPKDPDMVEFDSYTVWIHRASYIPVKMAFEKGGTVYRTAEVQAVETIEGFRTITKSKMSDSEIGGYTVIEYSDVSYNVGLTEDVFTERRLRNPPSEYIK